MCNAGTFYPQYFLGWPALLAPFTVLGLPWLANPVYLMLTVPAWFWVMRHAAGPDGSDSTLYANHLFTAAPGPRVPPGRQTYRR